MLLHTSMVYHRSPDKDIHSNYYSLLIIAKFVTGLAMSMKNIFILFIISTCTQVLTNQ